MTRLPGFRISEEASMVSGYKIGGGIGLVATAIFLSVYLRRPPAPPEVAPPAPKPSVVPSAPAPEFPLPSLEPRRSPAPSGPPRAPGSIDLLDLIDCSRDARAGRWGFDGAALYTSSVAWGRLQVPYPAPEEYDLRIRLRRESGSNSFNLGLSNGNRQFMIVLDGNAGSTSGIDLLDERGFSLNETTVSGKVLQLGKPATLAVSVRRTGIALSVDDHRLIDWKGSPVRLGYLEGWMVSDARSFVLGSWETLYRIEELTLLPVPSR
jgi:hypothetical protein